MTGDLMSRESHQAAILSEMATLPRINWSEKLHDVFQQRPVASVAVIFVIDVALAVGLQLAARALPTEQAQTLTSLIVLSALLAVVLTAFGWWRAAGFNGPSQWRSLGLLLIPVVVTGVLPLIAGIKSVDASTTLFFVASYILVAFREESLYRGIVLRILGPLGPRRAVLLSSAFFGVSHLANLLFRSNPGLVFAQVIGAFTFGVGVAGLRYRINTIWFLMLIHLLQDFMLHYTQLPSVPLNVVEDALLFFFGMFLIWRLPKENPEAAASLSQRA